jgi:deazaflavin-dependent oxidoreductase (nitroreductase family)
VTTPGAGSPSEGPTRPGTPTLSGPEPAQPAPPSGILRTLLGLPVLLYHAHLGVLLGHRFLLLVHTGRRTGVRRETVVEVVHYDADARESVVMAGWGRRTGWLHNVEAGLAHEVRIGRERFAPAYRILPPDEAERAFADYERQNRFMAPIVRSVLSRLLGWRYDGTREARRRMAAQLPLVAFRPRQPD